MRTTPYAIALGAFAMLSILADRAEAAQMFRFDLQSLAYMSTAVVEGDVTAYERVHWVDKLSVKITRAYAGEFKEGDTVVAGLSAYAKAGADAFTFERFGVGDHLILFLEPVTQQSWKDDAIPFWPVSSGLKLIVGGKVTGMEQMENPGPYVNNIAEGDAEAYPQKVADAVKWAAEFRKELKEKKSDPAWLLEQLKARPPLKKEEWGVRDDIAVTLCQAIANTGDKDAIARAKALREDRLERQILNLPPQRDSTAAQ